MLTKRRCVKTPASKMKLSLKVSGIKNSNYGCEQRHCGRPKTREIFFLYIFYFFIWIENMMMQQRTRGCLLYFPVCFFIVFFFPCERIDIPTCSQDVRNITSFMQSEDVLTQKSACGCFFLMKYQWGEGGPRRKKEEGAAVKLVIFSPFAQRQLIKGLGDSTSLN